MLLILPLLCFVTVAAAADASAGDADPVYRSVVGWLVGLFPPVEIPTVFPLSVSWLGGGSVLLLREVWLGFSDGDCVVQ